MFVDKEKSFERLAICNGCEHLFKPTWTCKECGCFMKVKARLSFTECPIGLWHKEDESIP
jgi:rRNA maturation endonuclease Nob1